MTLDAELQSLSASGGYLSLLTANHLRVFTSDLTLYYETTGLTGTSRAAVREDGTSLLIGSSSATLYLP